MFLRTSDGQLVGIGALKHPGPGYRNRVFANAEATVASDAYRIELGWVVVAKTHQGRGLSTRIVGELLPFTKNENIFATTRADEQVMRYAAAMDSKSMGNLTRVGAAPILFSIFVTRRDFPTRSRCNALTIQCREAI